MSPLQLSLLEGLLNRLLQADPDSQSRLRSLEEKCIRVETYLVSDHSVYICFDSDGICLNEVWENEPDAVISGGPAGFLRSATNASDRSLFSDGTLRVDGDVALVQQFADLFRLYQPDWQDALSPIFGEVLTGQFEALLEDLKARRESTTGEFVRFSGDFLTEEQEILANQVAVDEFADAVDELVADFSRLEQRIERLARHEVEK